MSKITSENCKDFLVEHFNNKNIETSSKEWKRTSKYKENDIWHRDFIHDKIGQVTVIEDNGSLTIKDTLETDYVAHPKFSKQELEGAKRLVEEYIDQGFVNCYQKEIYSLKTAFMVSEEWKKYHHAIPGLFTFSLPDDTHHNDIENVTDGLNTPMKIDANKSFSILLLNAAGNICEQYEQEILKQNFLPSYTDFIDEFHITFNPCPDNLTVGQAITYLESLGMVYGAQECLFKDYVEKTLVQQKDIDVNVNIGNSYNVLTINDNLNKVLETDNVNDLKAMIANGLNINIILVNKNKLAVEAFKNNSYNCITEILNHKDLDLWLLSEGYNPENKVTVASEILEILNFNSHKYPNDNYTLMILDKLIIPQSKEEEYVNKCEHILNSTIKNNKHHPYCDHIINKIEQLLPEEQFNTFILGNFKEVSHKYPQLLEKTLAQSSVGTLSTIVEQHALVRDYKVVLFLLDKKLINPQNVMVKNNDLRTYMALDINNYQKEIQSFIKDNMEKLSVTYQKKDKRYANELENMKSELNVMYGIWQHINPSNKLKK